MNSYIEAEVRRILNLAPGTPLRWPNRLPKGLSLYVSRNGRGKIVKVRYTAKSKGRTGAAVRFHLMEAARKRGMA